MEILSNHFRSVERRFHQDELRITDFAPIIDYFMSVRDERVHQIIKRSVNEIQDKFKSEIHRCGYYQVKTKGCLFICRKGWKSAS